MFHKTSKLQQQRRTEATEEADETFVGRRFALPKGNPTPQGRAAAAQATLHSFRLSARLGS
eukprot:CAMPEP_0171082862 /NCGR_PEP_ID=MMETSP0766_2-20121228/17369_1 /TAXON_ID=439317 /ORGANISM="Gambierdiscus australes, Strain CAWD 149" /LENGTH=60 /DNA_ID=CAMNT_0011540259 /DNA_START=121 /DNA_END=303 /DNA_ORIENTATION=+